MSLVYHERPGVYSSYDASSVIGRGTTERVIALVGKAEAKAGLYRLHSYSEAKEAFGEASELGRMAKIAYQNGAGTVLASPVAEDTLEAYQAALALVIVGALAATVLALGNRHQRVTYDFGTDAPFVEGVDISEHNGTVDWTTLAKSAKFAFIRVGYRGYNDGALHADKMAKENLKAARKAGMPVGVYFFSQATTEEEAQEEARFVLEAVRFAKVELPLIIDYEYGYNAAGEHAGRLYDANVSKKDTTRLLTAFCDTVTADGYTAGVYANSHFYISKFDAASLPKGTLRWVADYNSAVTYTGDFDIWQYSKTGKIKGNGSKYIDLNRWYLGGS